MFRRDVKSLDSVLAFFLRQSGLETPLLQKRLIDSWEEVMGKGVARFTGEKFISNQTFMVKIENAALRAELSMMRSRLVEKLNAHVGARVIADIKFF